MWRARAPVRVDFTGGYTDCSPFTDREWGRAVNLAIARYATATARRLPGGQVRAVPEVAEGARPAQPRVVDAMLSRYTRAGLHRLRISTGVQVAVELDVPAGCGLGTSGASGVAILAALSGLFGCGLEGVRLARLAALVERDIGIAGGWQDQYAAVLGGAHSYTFTSHPTEPDSIPSVRLTPSGEAMYRLQQHLLVVVPPPPEVRRSSSSLVKQVARRQTSHNVHTLAGLYALNGMAGPLATALATADVAELARLVNQVRRAQALLAPGVVDARVAHLVDTMTSTSARTGAAADVLAGKPCGGGGPGAAWLLIVEPERANAVSGRLAAAGMRVEAVQAALTGCRVFQVRGEAGRTGEAGEEVFG
ncbi:MAG: hypothetical protein ACJ73S_03720 [Mycobacteriales bacterium]